MAPPASAISYHRAASRCRDRATRNAHTTTSGITAARSTIESASCAQASSAATTTGTHQRGRRTRSRMSRISSNGTDVPMWSGEERSTLVPEASCGASMIPTAIATRATAARPVAVPLATSAANSSTSV